MKSTDHDEEQEYISLLCSENAHYLCFEGCDCKCHEQSGDEIA